MAREKMLKYAILAGILFFNNCRYVESQQNNIGWLGPPILPTIDTLQNADSFRSSRSHVTVVFTRPLQPLPNSNKPEVKLAIFYFETSDGKHVSNVDESIRKYPINSEAVSKNHLNVITFEAACRLSAENNDGQHYLCPASCIEVLFPDFTADKEFGGYTLDVPSLEVGSCNIKNSPEIPLFFGVLVNKKMVSFDPRNNQSNEQRLCTITYYPDPVVTSVVLLPSNKDVIKISGPGFNQKRFHPQFDLLANVPSKNVTIPIECTETFTEDSDKDNGFSCRFDPDQIAPYQSDDDLEITVRTGNWSDTKRLNALEPTTTSSTAEQPPPEMWPPRIHGFRDRPRMPPQDWPMDEWPWFDGNEWAEPSRNWTAPASGETNSLSNGDYSIPGYVLKIIVPICAGVTVLLIISVIIFCCCLRRNRLPKFLEKLSRKHSPLQMARFSIDLLPPEMIASLSKHQLDKKQLKIVGSDLGEGFFGIVKSAMLYTTADNKERYVETVAVKTIQRFENLEVMKEFFEEAIVMFSLDHPNVLSAIGFVNDLNGYPALVLPLMDGGNLHDFVKSRGEFNTVMMYNFAWQIAKGMDYLAKLKLVHRDLAARNCLLNKQLVVKVSDFGLTRHSETINYEYGTPEYKMLSHYRPLPIRWLAPECLEAGVFTEKTDVWAFGVLLWEMATRGERPYGELESSRIVTFIRCGNGRLSKTDEMPQDFYDLMVACWNEHSSDRPNFEELVGMTKALLDNNKTQQSYYVDPSLGLLGNKLQPASYTSVNDKGSSSDSSTYIDVLSGEKTGEQRKSSSESNTTLSLTLENSSGDSFVGQK